MPKNVVALVAAGILALVSCSKYPPSAERLTEDLVIYTKYDTKTDFNQFQTFAIVDSILYISAKDSGYYLTSEGAALLAKIADNMVQRGYIRVAHDANPDLGINMVVVKNTTVNVYSPGWYWGYYGYYPPDYWGYPYYDYYYPYYPVYVDSYSTGTVIIDMADLVNVTADHKVPVIWNAYIRALMTGRHTLNELENSVDQAFEQTIPFNQ